MRSPGAHGRTPKQDEGIGNPGELQADTASEAEGCSQSDCEKATSGVSIKVPESLTKRILSSGNVRVLLLTAALFALITLAQIVAALAANSLALLQDSVSMGVDAITYVGNIVVETQRGRYAEVALEVGFGLVSIIVLFVFTLLFMLEARTRLTTANDGSSEDDATNPYIVLAFAIWGLVFDLAAMVAFLLNHRKSSNGKKVNMCTAFLHVGADFLRSSTALIASILMLGFGYNTGHTDAWASLLVGAVILAGAMTASCAIFNKLRHCLCRAKPNAQEEE